MSLRGRKCFPNLDNQWAAEHYRLLPTLFLLLYFYFQGYYYFINLCLKLTRHVLAAFNLIKSKVLEPQLKAEKLVDRAAELTTGNESQLTKLIQSGDVSRAVQLAKAAIVAVDEDKKTQPVTQQQLKEKRKEVSNY